MKSIRNLFAPHYLLRPRQIWRRMRRGRLLRDGRVCLAWELPVRVVLDEVGRTIVDHGVFDLAVPEAICRLLDPGENAVDVGAHIGQNASMMALASESGRVLAYEPHPFVHRLLQENCESWKPYRLASIEAVEKALSSEVGEGTLRLTADQGASTLESAFVRYSSGWMPTQTGEHLVDVTTLDTSLPEDFRMALLKLDVEGHEEQVLRGAQRLIASGQPRDLLFEDYQPKPSRVTNLLEGAGFVVFALCARWSRPCLVPWRAFEAERPGVTYHHDHLATRMPARALERFRSPGWRCLRKRAAPIDSRSRALAG